MTVTYTAPGDIYGSVLSTTLRNIAKTVPDQVTKGLLLFWWLNDKKHKRFYDGGQAISLPIMLDYDQTPSSYRGYETGEAAHQEGITQAIFPWRQCRRFVTISGIESFQNSGQYASVDLMAAKVDQAVVSLQKDLERQIYGDGTGNSYKDILGLKAIVPANWATAPVSIGMVSTSNSDWAPQQVDCDADDTITKVINHIRTLYNNCSIGRDHPTILISPQYIFEYYERYLQPSERYMNKDVVSGDFEGLLYKGAPWFFDQSMPVGQGDKATEGCVYVLNHNHLWLAVARGADFTPDDFQKPPLQDAWSAAIKSYLNLVTDMRRTLGIAWDVDLAL